ncbi:hypothetical protein [Alkaliphilus crotonatoxidans]
MFNKQCYYQKQFSPEVGKNREDIIIRIKIRKSKGLDLEDLKLHQVVNEIR